MSLLQAARLMEALDYPIDEVIDVYARATATAPTRAEALYGASRFCRYKGRFEQGYQLAKRGMAIRQPNGGLFVEPWIYDYGLLDELAVNAYWARYYQESLDACEKLLANSKFPVSQRDRIIANANFATGKLSDAGGRLPYDCQMQEHSPRPLKMPYFLGEVTMDSKFPFNICHVSINVHDRIFDDTIRVLRSALGDLGYPCSVQKNHLKAQAINIVVGSVVFAAKSGFLDYLKQQPYVLYQFEQLDYNYGHINAYPEYLDIIRSADQIFEYSPSGMHYLSQTGMGGKIAYLPPSFHRSLESFRPDENPDIDVLFFGSFSDRRNKILNELRSRGLKVVHAFGVYGRELVHHMKRAKIIINIHCVDGISTLETVRISLALANRCFVISEIGDHNPYGAGVVYADYDNLVSTCIEYLNYSAHECPAIATAGYVEYRRSDFVADLRSALSRMPMRDLLRGVGSTGGTSEVTSADQNCVGNRLEPSGNLDPYLKYDLTSGLHTGIPYLEFLKIISSQMRPRSYLEIGTESGVSLRQFECDAICIDPAFQITSDVLAKRERTFFFQMTSNCFFANADPLKFFPRGVDVGFLDGLHHFEALLMDFINFEHNSHANSMAILHDCLPTDLLMTSRTFRWGGWTGDVWRVLLALKKYRQDLRIMLLDCPPTGLVVCTGMDSGSTILEARYEEIVEEFSAIHLDEAGLRGLRSLFPLVDTRKFLADGMGIARLFAPISW
jgi:hypothetical protein